MMQAIGKSTKEIRLGIPPMISSFVFSDIYKNFVLENKDIELTITEKGRYELLDKLNDGLLDIVLLPHTKPFDKSFSVKKIGRLEVVACVSKNNPLSKEESVSPKMLKDTPLVLFSDSFFQTKTIKNWFADAGVTPVVSVQTEQLSTAKRMVENNLAAGFMFRNTVGENSAIAALSLSPAIHLDVSVLRKKDAYATDGIKRLEKYLEEKCRL